MKEEQMKLLVRDCIKEYYEENKKILIDSSVLKIACIIYLLYNNVFFGSEVLLTKETFNEILKESKNNIYNKRSEIRVNNAKFILQAIEKNNKEGRKNYQIIEIGEHRYGKIQCISNFLEQNTDVIFYLADVPLYQDLRNKGVSNKRLKFLEIGMREVNPFQYKNLKFETIGAIKFDNGEMLIRQRENNVIKVYDKTGKEKNNIIKKVEIKDNILIIGKKEDRSSIILYQIVSRHTRNHAIRIIWTNLKKGEKTNQYIDRLPYLYKKIILDNVDK